MAKFKLTQLIEVYQTTIVEAKSREDALKMWRDEGWDKDRPLPCWKNACYGKADRIISVDELTDDGENELHANDIEDGEFVD